MQLREFDNINIMLQCIDIVFPVQGFLGTIVAWHDVISWGSRGAL